MQQAHPAQGLILQFFQQVIDQKEFYAIDIVRRVNAKIPNGRLGLHKMSVSKYLSQLVVQGLLKWRFETDDELYARTTQRRLSDKVKLFSITEKGKASTSTAKKILRKNKSGNPTKKSVRRYFLPRTPKRSIL